MVGRKRREVGEIGNGGRGRGRVRWKWKRERPKNIKIREEPETGTKIKNRAELRSFFYPKTSPKTTKIGRSYAHFFNRKKAKNNKNRADLGSFFYPKQAQK